MTKDQYREILQEFYETLSFDELLLVVLYRDIANPLTKEAKKIAEATLLGFGKSQDEMLSRHQEIIRQENLKRNLKTRIGEQWFYNLWEEDQNLHLRTSQYTNLKIAPQKGVNILKFYEEYADRESVARTSVHEEVDDEVDVIIHYGKYESRNDSSKN